MTRNGVTCVEWSGPFPVAPQADLRTKGDHRTVYRVDLDGTPVYVGCTRYPIAFRLYQHSRRRDEFGALLRAGGDGLSVWTIQGACGRVEGRLIHTMQPRFNRRERNIPKVITKHRQSLARHRRLYEAAA